MHKIHVTIGAKVLIIAGDYKNETGKIIKIDKKSGKVVVKGVNFKFKHMKPNTENEIGEIKQFEAPIHHSNVRLT
jgi:large subunit ribosomal protein L24